MEREGSHTGQPRRSKNPVSERSQHAWSDIVLTGSMGAPGMVDVWIGCELEEASYKTNSPNAGSSSRLTTDPDGEPDASAISCLARITACSLSGCEDEDGINQSKVE